MPSTGSRGSSPPAASNQWQPQISLSCPRRRRRTPTASRPRWLVQPRWLWLWRQQLWLKSWTGRWRQVGCGGVNVLVWQEGGFKGSVGDFTQHSQRTNFRSWHSTVVFVASLKIDREAPFMGPFRSLHPDRFPQWARNIWRAGKNFRAPPRSDPKEALSPCWSLPGSISEKGRRQRRE